MVHQPGDALVLAVAVQEILTENDEQLPADRLVAVHVGDELDHGLARAALTDILRDLQHEEVSTLHGLADGEDPRQVRVLALQGLEQPPQVLVVRVGRADVLAVARLLGDVQHVAVRQGGRGADEREGDDAVTCAVHFRR